jgi:hypothetical protein
VTNISLMEDHTQRRAKALELAFKDKLGIQGRYWDIWEFNFAQ